MNRKFKRSLAICSLLTGLVFTACSPEKGTNAPTDSHTAKVPHYTCEMHPEVEGKKGDHCPKCGMELTEVSHWAEAKLEVLLQHRPEKIEAGVPAELSFSFLENNQEVPLEISHEKKVHLMVVDETLTHFRHIHPEEQQNGTYLISETFPAEGKYILFTDYKPEGRTPVVDKKEINVGRANAKAALNLSLKHLAVADGYTLKLENADNFKTHRAQSLEISVEKNGRKLTEGEIEPYLGATAHIAMINAEEKNLLHIHPMPHDKYPIYAKTHIETAGIYRVWVEFQTEGKVHTADFTIQVGEGISNLSEAAHHHHH